MPKVFSVLGNEKVAVKSRFRHSLLSGKQLLPSPPFFGSQKYEKKNKKHTNTDRFFIFFVFFFQKNGGLGAKMKNKKFIKSTKKAMYNNEVLTAQPESATNQLNIKKAIATPNSTIFKIQTADEFIEEAKKRPTPTKLFNSFWFENEVCVLFADTNIGKSILAVQIGNSIANGQHALYGDRFVCPEPQKVLYFDFELSDKQFQLRYTEDEKTHYFGKNFLRVEIDHESNFQDDLEIYLISEIEKAVQKHDCRVLIVDNITFLAKETEKAKDALPLMKELQSLKKRLNLSILVLAHTPKRDQHRPISINDIQGSKMIANFADSAFSIGKSCRDSRMRYLKQLKVRNCEHEFDSENVIECEILQMNAFTYFRFLGFGSENSHLKEQTEAEQKERNAKIKEMHSLGKSQTEIAKDLNITQGAVSKIIKKIQKE